MDGLSFVDCTTVSFLQARKWTDVYSFDEDFDRVPKVRRLTSAPGRSAGRRRRGDLR
ncbi:MAG TPA: hypothetical protein VHH36_06130 [Candidatus Thermoplasmatota archaeon]|nr:hypothetical protein [Candidatus Thermoplasmatota archaeon]